MRTLAVCMICQFPQIDLHFQRHIFNVPLHLLKRLKNSDKYGEYYHRHQIVRIIYAVDWHRLNHGHGQRLTPLDSISRKL